MQRGMQINDTQARQNREHHHQRRRDVWKVHLNEGDIPASLLAILGSLKGSSIGDYYLP